MALASGLETELANLASVPTVLLPPRPPVAQVVRVVPLRGRQNIIFRSEF